MCMRVGAVLESDEFIANFHQKNAHCSLDYWQSAIHVFGRSAGSGQTLGSQGGATRNQSNEKG